MKKKTIQSFFILTFSVSLAKLFNILNRMILARQLGEEGIGLYMLMMPTLGLWVILSQMSIPSAIFKLVADKRYNNKKVMISGFIMTMLTTFLFMGIFLLLLPIFPTQILKNENTALPLRALFFFIPLTSLSALLKNYYLGKKMHQVTLKTQISEEVVRLLFTFYFLERFIKATLSFKIALLFIAMALGELASIIHLLFYVKDKVHFQQDTFDVPYFNDLFKISIPLTGSRLLHCLTSFLEPIIITRILLHLGYTSLMIQKEYGMMNGYVLSMITMPTFLTTVIYRLVLPEFLESMHHKKRIRKILFLSLLICLMIALPFTYLFYQYPEFCLQLLYKTTHGSSYLKYLSIPFILYYLQTPFNALLQALDRHKTLFFISFIECFLEIILLLILTPQFHILAMAITLLIGIVVTLVLSVLACFRFLFFDKE